MLQNGQCLADRQVRCYGVQRWLQGSEPCGIITRRSSVLRFQRGLMLGHAVLEGVPWRTVHCVQEAAEALSNRGQLSLIDGWSYRVWLGRNTLGQLGRHIGVQGRQKGLAFGHPFVGQGTELVDTPALYGHGSSPPPASCKCFPRLMKSSPRI